MQPIRHEPEFVQGFEVLNFPQVELEKVRADGAHTFATLGNLSVFYFDYFERFVLQLNNWRYCLMPKLPTTAKGQPGLTARDFVMPAFDGTYTLKLSQIMSPAALQNFETILSGATRFSHAEPQEFSLRPTEMAVAEFGQNPVMYSAAQPGVFYERPAEMGFGSYTGSTGNTTSSMSSMGNSDVKKSKLKMGLSKMKQKFSKKNKVRREPNINLTQLRDYQSIRATPANMVTVVDFRRQDIEAAIVSTKEIIRKLEGPPGGKKEEVKEKVLTILDAVKEGVQDIRGKIAERHEHEAKTGEHIGIMEIVKEGIHEIKDKITGKGHLEDGEIEPREDPFGTTTVRRTEKPGIVETVKHEYLELKERAAARQELNGAPVEKIGIMDIVKEGVLEIKEKLAKKGHEEVIVDKTETVITQPGVIETHSTRIIVNEPPRVYESHRSADGRLKIFDDKYLDKPLHAQPFPISGSVGTHMVNNYEEFSKPVIVPTTVTTVEYRELERPQPSMMEKIKAKITGEAHHLPVKETHVPVGHASGNISDRIMDRIHGTSGTVAPIEPAQTQKKPGMLDKVQVFLGTKDVESHSPVKKRELIKAFIKSQPEESQEQGRLAALTKVGGIMGVAKAGGLSGITKVAVPMMMGKKVDEGKQTAVLGKSAQKPTRMDMIKSALPFGHKNEGNAQNSKDGDQPGMLDKVKGFFTPKGENAHTGPSVMETPTVVVPTNIHSRENNTVYEQPIIERHVPVQLQPSVVSTHQEPISVQPVQVSTIIEPKVTSYQVHQDVIPAQPIQVSSVLQPSAVSEVYQVSQEAVPIQGRVIDRRVERVVNPQVVIPQAGEQVYETHITHYEG